MGKIFLALVCAFGFNIFAIASEGSSHEVAPAPEGGKLSLEEILSQGEATIEEDGNGHHEHYWHCTAYPEGHGHQHGYSYRDEHYNHAYWGAVQQCERATNHHCHDVHCHQD